jgi:hypothetical protein
MCVDASLLTLVLCHQINRLFFMRSPFLRSIVWAVACAVMVLLAVTTGSAVAHELQHAAHHNAGMHGSGICAWMCATAGTHVATPVHSTPLFALVGLLTCDSDHARFLQPLAPSHARAPPVLV